jgi:hypothetical protein
MNDRRSRVPVGPADRRPLGELPTHRETSGDLFLFHCGNSLSPSWCGWNVSLQINCTQRSLHVPSASLSGGSVKNRIILYATTQQNHRHDLLPRLSISKLNRRKRNLLHVPKSCPVLRSRDVTTSFLICCHHQSPWWWRQQVPPKLR